MGVSDLPVEILFSILRYIVPEDWTGEYLDEDNRPFLRLRLVCSKSSSDSSFVLSHVQLTGYRPGTFDSLVLQCILEVVNDEYLAEDEKLWYDFSGALLGLGAPLAFEQLRLGRCSPILDAIRETSRYLLNVAGEGDSESLLLRYQKALCFVAGAHCVTGKITHRWQQGFLDDDWPSMKGDRHTEAVAATAYLGDVTFLQRLLQMEEAINPFHEIFGDPLHAATQQGHQAAAWTLLEASADLGTSQCTGRSAIHWAALHGLEEVLTRLLHRYGALINAEDWRGDTALSLAARSGKVGASRILLEHQELEATLTNGWNISAMELAARHGHVETVKFLMAQHATFDRFGFASLRAAALHGQVAVVNLLNDPSPNASWANEDEILARTRATATIDDPRDPYLKTICLLIALNVTPGSYHGYSYWLRPNHFSNNRNQPQPLGKEKLEVLAILLSRKDVVLFPLSRNVKGPVEWAACIGSEEVMRLMIRKDPTIADCVGYKGRTPLSFAAQYGNVGVVRLLVNEYHAQPDAADDDGRTPLFYAAGQGQTNVMRFLLDLEGVLADRTGHVGLTPLAFAAKCGFVEPIRLLLDRPDVAADTMDQDGLTPLAWAAHNPYDSWLTDEVIEFLVDRDDVDLNSRDKEGRTPLFIAAGRQFWDGPFESLLLTRPDTLLLDAKDNAGVTPLMHAAQSNEPHRVNLLLKHGAQADCRDNTGRTALSYAAEFGSLETLKLLADWHDVHVDCKDDSGRTPLSYAAGQRRYQWRDPYDRDDHERPKRVELLLHKHASPALLDNDGRNHLSYALEQGHEDVVRLLQHAMSST
jgi:ankyrin repeat protein